MSDSLLTEEQKEELIKGAMDGISEYVVEQAKNQAVWTTKSVIQSKVGEAVSEYVKEEIIPALLIELQENKSMILDAAIMSASEMAVILAESMSRELAENLSQSWKRKKIFEALFD